jgi:adenylosuccinate synthase
LKAYIVVDLGFGDAGKGLMTDYLVRRHAARHVIRFNGGAQAGHNVVEAGGRHHTFSQLGSGSFHGARTHLARPVIVHPTALALEAQRLAELGERDVLERVSIDPECRVTTPLQQAAGRLRELQRGAARHGSCGVGVGETATDSIDCPELTVRFEDLLRPASLLPLLHAQRLQKLRVFGQLLESRQPPQVARELELLASEAVAARWLDAASSIARRVTLTRDEELRPQGTVVFEGAQGILLDENYGFHPFTTYSRTTPDAALDILRAMGFAGDVQVIGALRSYSVRHGPGPFPTEDASVVSATLEQHNSAGPWQGAVRKGWLDLVLVDYALRAAKRIDALAVTHLDALPQLRTWRWCEAYDSCERLELPRTLAEQEQLCLRLTCARPRYHSLNGVDSAAVAHALFERLARRCRASLAYGVTGPFAHSVHEL